MGRLTLLSTIHGGRLDVIPKLSLYVCQIENYENIRSSIFNSTYNKNGTEGAVVETIINLLKSDTVTMTIGNITYHGDYHQPKGRV